VLGEEGTPGHCVYIFDEESLSVQVVVVGIKKKTGNNEELLTAKLAKVFRGANSKRREIVEKNRESH